MALYFGDKKIKVHSGTPTVSDGVSLPTLANPGSASDLMSGKELIDSTGKKVAGTFTLESEISDQDALLEELQSVLEGKVAAGGAVETCTVAFDFSDIDMDAFFDPTVNAVLLVPGNASDDIFVEYDLLVEPTIVVPKNAIVVFILADALDYDYQYHTISTASESGGATFIGDGDYYYGRDFSCEHGDWFLITGDATITLGVKGGT